MRCHTIALLDLAVLCWTIAMWRFSAYHKGLRHALCSFTPTRRVEGIRLAPCCRTGRDGHGPVRIEHAGQADLH